MLRLSLRYLWRLHYRLTDAIVLALVATACSAWAYYLMGVQHQGLLVVFVVTWLSSAAKRFSDFRRGVYSPLKAYGPSGNAVPAILVGTGPWIVLVFLYNAYPASFIWMSGSLPVWLNLIGVALALIALARPHMLSFNGESEGSNFAVPRLTVHAQLLALALLLMSGSLVIALVLGIWLVMLHLTAERPHSSGVSVPLVRVDLEPWHFQSVSPVKS